MEKDLNELTQKNKPSLNSLISDTTDSDMVEENKPSALAESNFSKSLALQKDIEENSLFGIKKSKHPTINIYSDATPLLKATLLRTA